MYCRPLPLEWTLVESVDHLVLQFRGTDKALTFDKNRGDCRIRSWTKQDEISTTIRSRTTVFGFLGVIPLLRGDYAIFVRRHEHVNNLLDRPVFRVLDALIVPTFNSPQQLNNTSANNQNANQNISNNDDESEYVAMLSRVLAAGDFYYSPSLDLTNSIQRQDSMSRSMNRRPFSDLFPLDVADQRFMWNSSLSRRLIDLLPRRSSSTAALGSGIDDSIQNQNSNHNLNENSNLNPNSTNSSGGGFDDDHHLSTAAAWIVPVIRGFVSWRSGLDINGRLFSFGLVSRMSWRFAGTRFNARGITEDGFVANYTETEQILVGTFNHQAHIASYVQIRGSIPLFWTQIPNLKYKPALVFNQGVGGDLSQKHSSACAKHFQEQTMLYDRVMCVNLIDKRGMERRLGEKFESEVRKLNSDKISYTWFDFHRECRKMRFDRVSILHEMVREEFDSFDYYLKNLSTSHLSSAPIHEQRGVTRVNCIDCLDRTNVVQAYFARVILERQMRDLNILGVGEAIEDHLPFEGVFRNVWADNANAVSLIYSGTNALKTDFTRTGVRTSRGAFDDFVNSAKRYYLNNFADGSRQDATELLVGNYRVDRRQASPFVQYNQSHAVSKWILRGFLASGLVLYGNGTWFNASESAAVAAGSTSTSWAKVAAWGLWAGLFAVFLNVNGTKLADSPRFNKRATTGKTD